MNPRTANSRPLRGEGIRRAFLTLHYVDLNEIMAALPPELHRRPSLWRQLLGWLALTVRSLPFFVGAQKPCDAFRNLDDARGDSPALPP